MTRQYYPLLKYSLLDDFSLDAGWIELNENVGSIELQDNYKFGTLKYKNGLSNLTLF